jgi:hypothetical protein
LKKRRRWKGLKKHTVLSKRGGGKAQETHIWRKRQGRKGKAHSEKKIGEGEASETSQVEKADRLSFLHLKMERGWAEEPLLK